jgi:molybdopterin/thiamine biosynthesis adenylyltransferase
VGATRAEATAAQLRRLFPSLAIEALATPTGPEGWAALAAQAGAVVGAAELPDQLAAHDAAVAAGRPLVHGGVLRYGALLLTVLPGATACLRCLFEDGLDAGGNAPPGELGPLAGFVGGLAADEAARLLRSAPSAYGGRALTYEARGARVRAVALYRRSDCATCGGEGKAVAS